MRLNSGNLLFIRIVNTQSIIPKPVAPSIFLTKAGYGLLEEIGPQKRSKGILLVF
jgi:hypothetical protein